MQGPLAPFMARMVGHLDAQGYTPENVIRKMRLVGKLSRFLHETGRGVADLGTAVLEAFLREVDLPPSDRVTTTTLAWLSEFLKENGELAPSASPLLGEGHFVDRYRHYLTIERGLAPHTVDIYARFAQRFLVEHPEHELRDLNADTVTRYVTRECRRLDSIREAERMVTAFRSLLAFALLDGVTEPVKRCETRSYDALCATSSRGSGSLIHATAGSSGGSGRRRPNRLGLAA